MQNSFSLIKRSIAALREPNLAPDEINSRWQAFCETVRTYEEHPPYHLAILFDRIEHYRKDRSRNEISILDHGCGGGSSILYLLARGYTEIYGVDVQSDRNDSFFTPQNRVLQEIFGKKDDRFIIYDGKNLPYANDFFDVIFSQQVIEHVEHDCIDDYYREEGRVLKPGGIATHQVPHRLVPYESHAQTWLIHYLPLGLQKPICSVLGIEFVEGLFLRWPSYHWRKINRHIGPSIDMTLERFTAIDTPDYYDGPVKLRNLLTRSLKLKVLGKLFGVFLKSMVMKETLSTKLK